MAKFIKRQFEVTLQIEVPEDAVHVPALRRYIKDALASWGGQFDPWEDPLFDGVSVRSAKFKIKGIVARRKLHA